MTPRIVLVIVVSAAALLLFGYVARQLSFISVGMAANAEVQQLLRDSVEDQKRLARLDHEHGDAYRRRFDEIRTTLHRIEILALTRRELARQLESVLIAVVAGIVLTGILVYLLEQRSREQRLRRLGDVIEALSRGDANIDVGDNRRGIIGRIGRMIEETSRVMARERKRVQYLEHLSAWQEAARRHAHEIRTPLSAAQLEVDRLIRSMERRIPEAAEELQEAKSSIFEELELLRRFTRDFVSLARIGTPRPERHDLARLLGDFKATFAPNWPALEITIEAAPGTEAMVDRELFRQVLVNLCNNSALAVGEGGGCVRISVHRNGNVVFVDVADDGPGIPAEIRSRLFEPYATTRRIGEGMGLGLAISKKILLDHGGDLEWLESARGATFRMTLPAVTA